MGYVYDHLNRICCDDCGTATGVRRRRCPFGYCPRPALCGPCHKRTREGHRATHKARGCEAGAAEAAAREAERRALFAAGEALRCSALSRPTESAPDRVHVLFTFADGRDVGRFMPRELYRAFPLLANVTLARFESEALERYGRALEPAPASFYGEAS